MKLLHIHVENFGKLQNFEYMFEDGLNVLHQPNGWGKSTLAVFIKAMLYGLPATTKRSLDENERKKYAPWQGGAYGGSLELETERGRFRIERFFGDKESGDTFDLYDLDTNLPSEVYTERIGEELLGIDADGFERTVYLSQRDLKGGKDNVTVSAKLGNLLDDVDDIANYDTAIEALDKRRKFYVMTGGRGAIAELEQTIFDTTAELERCRKLAEAVEAQEAELAQNAQALETCKKEEALTRARLERVALSRERRALAEQKQKMLAELASLAEQRKKISASLGGNPPSDAELREAQKLHEEIRRAKARLDAIPTESPNAAELKSLQAAFSGGVPDEEYLQYLDSENNQLRRIHADVLRLQHSDALNPAHERFASGTPSKGQIERAFAALREADELARTAPVPQKAHARTRKIPAAITLLFGVVLAALSFLPSLSALSLPLLIAGCAVGVLGTILLVIPSPSGKPDTGNADRAELRAKQTELLRTVRALLETYRMPTDDLSRSLSELSLLAEQYGENLQQRDRAQKELEEQLVGYRALSDKLLQHLSRFMALDPATEDFAAAIQRLRGGVMRYEQLREEETRRASDRTSAEQALSAYKSRLLPFLRRFDADGTLSASQCLERIARLSAESGRLDSEIERRTSELRAFIAEKNLEEGTAEGSSDDLDRLSADAEALQTRMEALNRRHATLKGSIERLSLDADRIPDLEEELARTRARLTEAKANAETVKNTAKFLEEAKTALSTRYLGGMQASLARHLEALTELAPDGAVMDASFDVRLREGGKTHTMESFSRGWRDTVEFCTRLSLTEALYAEGERPFLLLDDPFVNLDDTRMDAAKALLARLADDYQILYLVCHTDRVV